MTTELLNEDFPLALTSKNGGPERGNVLQVTVDGPGYTDITADQAREMAAALMRWVNGTDQQLNLSVILVRCLDILHTFGHYGRDLGCNVCETEAAIMQILWVLNESNVYCIQKTG